MSRTSPTRPSPQCTYLSITPSLKVRLYACVCIITRATQARRLWDVRIQLPGSLSEWLGAPRQHACHFGQAHLARHMNGKFLVACAAACIGLVTLAGVSMREEVHTTSFVPKDGEVVAIKSLETGRYLEVSQDDGKLRANATRSTNRTALFRITLLTPTMVEMLVDAMRTTNKAVWARRKQVTTSGCTCSGYSNDHGFGAYCFSWEYDAQTPWCYVSDACSSQTSKGSFGRKFEDCDPFEDDYTDEYRARQSQLETEYPSYPQEEFNWTAADPDSADSWADAPANETQAHVCCVR